MTLEASDAELTEAERTHPDTRQALMLAAQNPNKAIYQLVCILELALWDAGKKDINFTNSIVLEGRRLLHEALAQAKRDTGDLRPDTDPMKSEPHPE